ncbi:DVU0298 family protein [Anaeroselena agilis]|uniref:HEAT repeat domain-containing protein n=1 Tax=Anaeroselena agilis TaxID=3063788 RepID=A0ABU3P793_9FIRM|nr:HEAT repeat domain-containing protein [Selenomonadales bacterium 4137-cl]
MNREGVKRLLYERDWEEVVRLALIDRRVLRVLIGLLYDADDYAHWLAIDALGRWGGRMAADNPEKTRDLIRRLLWTLNDESGGNPWGATGAIGAVIAARPELFAGYLSMICPFHDDVNIYPEFIWSVAAVGSARSDLAAEYVPFLLDALGHASASIRAYAAWCLGALRVPEAAAALTALMDDAAEAAVYEGDGVYRRRTVGAIAAESLVRMGQARAGSPN